MNKEKVFIEGYEVGFQIDTLGTREKIIQLVSGETVSIDENFIYKSIEQEKVTIPQDVADWIEEARKSCKDVADLFDFDFTNEEVGKWFMQERPFDLVARAWLDGYEVEKEKRYFVKIKATKHYFSKDGNSGIYYSLAFKDSFTKKQLEDAGFGWVFDCPGIEIEEVME